MLVGIMLPFQEYLPIYVPVTPTTVEKLHDLKWPRFGRFGVGEVHNYVTPQNRLHIDPWPFELIPCNTLVTPTRPTLDRYQTTVTRPNEKLHYPGWPRICRFGVGVESVWGGDGLVGSTEV